MPPSSKAAEIRNMYDRALADWRRLKFVPTAVYTKYQLEEILDAAPTGGDFEEAVRDALNRFD